MRREEQLTLGAQVITVRELTVGEVRGWLASVEQAAADAVEQGDLVGLILLEDCTLADVQRMSDATAAQLDDLTQSELRDLVAACKELNPDFFGLRSRMMSLGRQMAASPT